MRSALSGAVDLLDRSLSYTRPALGKVEAVKASTPTPCHGWPLTQLLAHMDDALAAWTEAATGHVELAPLPTTERLSSIQHRACALLGWWLERGEAPVRIADRLLPAAVVVASAALELTLHGWDLHETAGCAVPVPVQLAEPLMSLALAQQHSAEPMPCLGPPRSPLPDLSDADRLVAVCGRG